ncbi:MAG: hypothetical protein V1647_03885, partial [Pseudomonadota bacterium]
MFPFVKLMPLIPALIIFGAGTFFLYYGKKNKSAALRTGGWVMSLGAVLLIVLVLFFFAKHKLSHEDKDRCGMNSMKHGCGCPMMD